MKLRHWQGYGTIEAKRLSKTQKDGLTTMHICVSGNHEYGLARHDEYDVANWLIKRFDRSFSDYRSIVGMQITECSENGIDVCHYVVTYKTPVKEGAHG